MFITLSSLGLKAFSTTAPVELGFEDLCGSLGSNLLSTSCSLGFAPALPFTGNISFSSFLFVDSYHTRSQLGLNKPSSSCTFSNTNFSFSDNRDSSLNLCML